DALVHRGAVDEGVEQLLEAGTLAEACVGADAATAYGRDRLARVRLTLAFALDEVGKRPGLECAMLREAVDLWQDLDAKRQLSGEDRPAFERARRLLATCASEKE